MSRIRAVRTRRLRLANTTLRTSYGSNVVEREHLFVAIEDEDGVVGYGEGSPLPHFSGERAGEMERVTQEVLGPALVGREALDVEGADAALQRAFPHHGASKAALISALLDLQGRRSGRPVHELLGGATRDEVEVVGAIGIEPVPEALERVARLRQAGHRTIKAKIGADVDRDVRLVHAIRDAHGDDLALRVDANGGYRLAEARRFARAVTDARLQYLEQPLPGHDLDGLARLRDAGDVPIAVDESLFGLHDALEIVRRGAADVFVIKLIKLGGLQAARKVAAVAEAAGLRCTAVSPYETALGASANLHLIAATSVFPYAAELGVGISNVALPGASELAFGDGRVRVPGGPGLGVEIPASLFES